MSDAGMWGEPRDEAADWVLPSERARDAAQPKPPPSGAGAIVEPVTRREIAAAQERAAESPRREAATAQAPAPSQAPAPTETGDLSAEVAALRGELTNLSVPDEALYEQPAEIAVWAAENGNEQLYQRAVGAMYDSGDPELTRAATQLEMARVAAPLYQARQEQDLGRWAREHPDLEQRQDAMVQAAQERPELRAAIERGGPEQLAALNELYALAGDAGGAAPSRERQRGGSSSAAERLGREWAAIDSTFSDGWNIS